MKFMKTSYHQRKLIETKCAMSFLMKNWEVNIGGRTKIQKQQESGSSYNRYSTALSPFPKVAVNIRSLCELKKRLGKTTKEKSNEDPKRCRR